MPSKPPDFQSALNFGALQMASCLARIAEQRQLLVLVRSALPEPLRQHAEHCVASGNKLIVYSRSAAWASQIRFFQQAILNKLQESGQRNLGTLQVRLLIDGTVAKSAKSKNLPSRQLVDGLILQTSAADDELQQSLNRLAQTLRNRQDRQN